MTETRTTIKSGTRHMVHIHPKLLRIAKKLKHSLSAVMQYRALFPEMAGHPDESEDITEWLAQERPKARRYMQR